MLHRIYSASNGGGDLNVSTFYAFKATDIPDCNTRRWPLFIETTYEDEDAVKTSGMKIDLSEFFEGDLASIIDMTIDSMISPAIFLDMMLINDAHHLDYTMDWQTKTITINEKVYSPYTHIAIYCDMAYYNDKLIGLNGARENRLTTDTYSEAKRIGDA